ncbi:MAG TPA: hypothetical protein VHF22_10280, partial [Planctomycetota bacterium]|nr:hypothetical protein [Planctomycetota bacterium]
DRLVIVDPGDLRTRAAAFALPGLEPAGAIEVESAVSLLESAPSLLPAYAGLDAPGETDPLPPIADPETRAPLAVGAAAADITGYSAFLAAGLDARKLETLVRAVLFALCEGGDRVELVLVADPGAKADRLHDLECGWIESAEPPAHGCEGDAAGPGGFTELAITAVDPTSSESEVKLLRVAPRMLDAGAALFEAAFARGALEPDGPPALVLDMGHRATRAYLLDPGQGILDLEIVPHGGASYLEHARRLSAEARDRGRDVSLLRQLARGTEMLQFGAFTRVTRKFFDEARRELAKAVASAVAARLRRHLEKGGRWPAALLIAGGLALPDGGEIVGELRARGCSFQRVRTLPRSPPPLVEGALAARAVACG